MAKSPNAGDIAADTTGDVGSAVDPRYWSTEIVTASSTHWTSIAATTREPHARPRHS